MRPAALFLWHGIYAPIGQGQSSRTARTRRRFRNKTVHWITEAEFALEILSTNCLKSVKRAAEGDETRARFCPYTTGDNMYSSDCFNRNVQENWSLHWNKYSLTAEARLSELISQNTWRNRGGGVVRSGELDFEQPIDGLTRAPRQKSERVLGFRTQETLPRGVLYYT